MGDGRGGGFAVVVVEGLDRHARHRTVVEAARVDVEAVGVAARHIETLDAAVPAEQMPCGAGVEGVFAALIRARDQAKTRGGNDQVQEAAHATDRAVAVEHLTLGGSIDFKTHATAMAATAMRHQRIGRIHARQFTTHSLPLPLPFLLPWAGVLPAGLPASVLPALPLPRAAGSWPDFTGLPWPWAAGAPPAGLPEWFLLRSGYSRRRSSSMSIGRAQRS